MRKILLAYDGGEAARRALETAADLAGAFGASISVVSVVPKRVGRAAGDPRQGDAEHARELQEARKLLAERGIEAETMEPAGDPARTIERIAEVGGFDTIVLGARCLGTAERVLQGSVSEHVVAHAHATVVVTH